MVGDDQRHALVAVHAAAQAADRLAAAQQALHRERAHRDDDLRLQQLHLPHQERLARREFVGRGVAIARRAALERVGDVDLARRLGLAPRQPERAQHAVEQLARLADEGLALPVFRLARRLADDHPVGALVADAEHRLAPTLAKRAGGAGGDGLAQRGPVEHRDRGRCGAGGSRHHFRDLRGRGLAHPPLDGGQGGAHVPPQGVRGWGPHPDPPLGGGQGGAHALRHGVRLWEPQPNSDLAQHRELAFIPAHGSLPALPQRSRGSSRRRPRAARAARGSNPCARRPA